jgi:hypothetical protein
MDPDLDDRSSDDDEAPTVVVLHEGDLSAEQVQRVKTKDKGKPIIYVIQYLFILTVNFTPKPISKLANKMCIEIFSIS